MAYPPVAFNFDVTFDPDLAGAKWPPADASFQEVSGIRVEFGSEEVAEGGENQFVHRLPTPPKYSNLVLKRGVVLASSRLAEWVAGTLGTLLSQPIKPRNLIVLLKNEQHEPLISWKFVNAYPVRWETSPLNAMESAILTETIELSYNYFERTVLAGQPSPSKAPSRAPTAADLLAGRAGLRKTPARRS